MPNIERVGDLEIGQDLDFQHRSWLMQRFGWLLVALTALAALLGLFGRGPLSKVTIVNETLSLDYNRFGRYQAPTTLRVNLSAAADDRQASVWLSRKYLESMRIEQITPEPEQVEVGSERLIYVFKLSKLNGPTAVTFYIQPEQIGSVAGQVGLVTGQTLSFNQLIYP